MIWDEFLRHFRFCDEEDSGLSDEEQERKGPKNRPKHTRKRIHQVKKNFLEKFKTASEYIKTKKTFGRNSKQFLSFLFRPVHHIIYISGECRTERLVRLGRKQTKRFFTIIVHHLVGILDASLTLHVRHERSNFLL